jgi:hypothetical protein
MTTSFCTFPVKPIWANPNFPNLDYADVHAYISTGWIDDRLWLDARYHVDYSSAVRRRLDDVSKQNGVKTKPIVRGEAGIDTVSQQRENPALARDHQGVWLHNFLWAGLDPGGLYELYWWEKNIAEQPGPDGKKGLHEIFRYYADFIRDIPINNGRYGDAQAFVDNPSLRVTGQKDTVNSRAHIWVQNKKHTWKNVVDGVGHHHGRVVRIGVLAQTTECRMHEFTTQGASPLIFNGGTIGGNIQLTLPGPTNCRCRDKDRG